MAISLSNSVFVPAVLLRAFDFQKFKPPQKTNEDRGTKSATEMHEGE